MQRHAFAQHEARLFRAGRRPRRAGAGETGVLPSQDVPGAMRQSHFHRRTADRALLDRKRARGMAARTVLAAAAAAAGRARTGPAAALGRTAAAALELECIEPVAVPAYTVLAAALGCTELALAAVLGHTAPALAAELAHTELELAAEPGRIELELAAEPGYTELELAEEPEYIELELAAEPERTEIEPVVVRTALVAEHIEPAAEPVRIDIALEAEHTGPEGCVGPLKPVGHIELGTGWSAPVAERPGIVLEVVRQLVPAYTGVFAFEA